MFLGILNETEQNNFLNLLINSAKIDGDFSENEKMKIQAYVNEMGTSLKAYSAYSKDNDTLINSFMDSSDEVKRIITLEITALMLADGLHKEEEKMLDDMINKFKLDSDYKKSVINWYDQIMPLYQKGFELVGLQQEVAR